MTRKGFIAPLAVALAVVAGAGGASNLAAHAAPGAARAAALTCQTTVLQQTPITGHNATHGYAYLMRNLCDGNVFLRVSTDLWGSTIDANLTTPSGKVLIEAYMQWGGHADSAEVPYTSGASYSYYGYVYGFWGDGYYGGGLYTAP